MCSDNYITKDHLLFITLFYPHVIILLSNVKFGEVVGVMT